MKERCRWHPPPVPRLPARPTLVLLAGVALSVSRRLFQDYDDDDEAMSSVDVGALNRLTVTIDHGSAKAVAPSHVNAQLIGSGLGVLTFDANGRAGGTEQTVTINNLLFKRASQNEKEGFSAFQLVGSCGWRRNITPTPVLYELEVNAPAVALFTIADKV